MYNFTEGIGYESIAEMAAAISEWLIQYHAQEGEDANFPESFVVWEEGEQGYRLGYVPQAMEFECGSQSGAWATTIRAYADPSAYVWEE